MRKTPCIACKMPSGRFLHIDGRDYCRTCGYAIRDQTDSSKSIDERQAQYEQTETFRQRQQEVNNLLIKRYAPTPKGEPHQGRHSNTKKNGHAGFVQWLYTSQQTQSIPSSIKLQIVNKVYEYLVLH